MKNYNLKAATFTICVIILIYGCLSLKKSQFRHSETAFDLIGVWTVSSEINDGVVSKCNACPKLVLDSTNSGNLIRPNGDEQKVRWKLRNNMLFLRVEKEEYYLKEKKYEIEFNTTNNYDELTISNSKSKRSYVLRRLPE